MELSCKPAVRPRGASGLTVNEVLGERTAELLTEEDKQARQFGCFLREARGAAFSVASDQPMSF